MIAVRTMSKFNPLTRMSLKPIQKLIAILIKNGADRSVTNTGKKTALEMFAEQTASSKLTNGDIIKLGKLLDPCTPAAEIEEDDQE